MPCLKLDNIAKSFEGRRILRDITLHSRKNEFVVVLGSSGCGKTTLLRIIAGLEAPTEGHVYLDSVDITGMHPQERNIGFVFQNFPVYSHLSVYENLATPLLLRRESQTRIADAVQNMASSLNITHLLKQPTDFLSGGELQRVAIGKALIKDPDIFLLDEPLSHLDTQAKRSALEALKSLLNRRKRLTIYVTHEPSEALPVADRIAVLDRGTILQFDNPETIYSRPQTLSVARLLGPSTLNLLDAALVAHDDSLFARTALGDLPLSGRNVSLPLGSRLSIGIKPSRIFLESRGKSSVRSSLTVAAVEYDGDHFWILVREIKNFKIRVEAKPKGNSLDTIEVFVEPEEMLVFDSSTEILFN